METETLADRIKTQPPQRYNRAKGLVIFTTILIVSMLIGSAVYLYTTQHKETDSTTSANSEQAVDNIPDETEKEISRDEYKEENITIEVLDWYSEKISTFTYHYKQLLTDEKIERIKNENNKSYDEGINIIGDDYMLSVRPMFEGGPSIYFETPTVLRRQTNDSNIFYRHSSTPLDNDTYSYYCTYTDTYTDGVPEWDDRDGIVGYGGEGLGIGNFNFTTICYTNNDTQEQLSNCDRIVSNLEIDSDWIWN